MTGPGIGAAAGMVAPAPDPGAVPSHLPGQTPGPVLALVAHDDKKDDMVAWSQRNRAALSGFDLVATGTTGSRVATAIDLPIRLMKSGPLGGDAQLGAMIAEGRLDVLIFFTDPLTAMPHDVDVKSLLRLAVLYDVPLGLSPRSADYILAGMVAFAGR